MRLPQAHLPQVPQELLGRLPLALFGLAVTLSLVTYNKRNDQLYDALVGRAAAIERELGVPDGAFAHRPTNWLSFGIWPLKWPVNHRHSVSGVYGAIIALWLFLALEGVFSATGRTWAKSGSPCLGPRLRELQGFARIRWHCRGFGCMRGAADSVRCLAT